MYQCVAENYWGIKYANAELRVIGENAELGRILWGVFLTAMVIVFFSLCSYV